MISLINTFQSGVSMTSQTNLMLSLASLWLVINVVTVVETTPVNYKTTNTMQRENHPNNYEEIMEVMDVQESNNQVHLSPEKYGILQGKLNRLEENDLRTNELADQSAAGESKRLLKQSLPAYFDPKHNYKQFAYHKRRRRELKRNPRKIASSSMPVQMRPAYYPFIMAEMIPGSVKTRHPSIIAVNGCPAYYIADHKGRCRQVFQYTVNFGQNSPQTHEATHSPQQKHGHFPEHNHSNHSPKHSTPRFRPKPVHHYHSSHSSSASPRLLSLLNATKSFDLSFLKQNKHYTNTSGEATKDGGIEKLRQKILSALKITKSKDNPITAPKDTHKDNGVSEGNTGSPDYDD